MGDDAQVQSQDSFSAAMGAYRARNFSEATGLFDVAAQGGDQNAALWAAKSLKDGGNCGAAAPRFDAVATKAAGSWTGREALLESARCQIALGNTDAAREKLGRLTGVPSHAAAAQQALGEVNQVASRQRKAAAPAAAAPPARAMPATSKPATDTANTLQGF
jgi:TolA-binding protein